MSAGVLYLRWTAPPDVPIPALPNPPDNAYPVCLQLVEKTRRAAVRAYRMRHGKYPCTLAEAGVADLNLPPAAQLPYWRGLLHRQPFRKTVVRQQVV
ncbi:MAG: hypothetical protein RMM08_01520 [Armatimonadota bacterium]|nr:hypothetical protein [Armatimonadota bacterium]